MLLRDTTQRAGRTSLLSIGSLFSIVSILSLLSAGSILSIGSAGGIMRIGGRQQDSRSQH